MTEALRLESVTKRYSGHTAVDELSLSIPTGTVYGILGPNGAGKSTTLRMVMNIIVPDSGTISLLGSDPARDRTVLRRVGYLPEERGLHRKMKVIDVVVFFAELKGVARGVAKTRGLEWLERMGLSEWADSKVETLSKGMAQKVQFITTVLHEPDLLILDEPQSGLDPVNQEVLRDVILGAGRQGRTVVLSTHYMQQAEQMCESVCIIARGRKVLDGRVRELRRAHRGNRFRIEFDEPGDANARFIEGSRSFSEATRRGEGWEVELAPGVASTDVLNEIAALDRPLARFEHIEPSLHDIFVARVGNAAVAERTREHAHA
jgi:ABC-2 type transport system ATP-binding protein